MIEEEKIYELMKLSGIIWKKAELNGDLEKFYLKILEKFFSIEELDERILEVFGGVGG